MTLYISCNIKFETIKSVAGHINWEWLCCSIFRNDPLLLIFFVTGTAVEYTPTTNNLVCLDGADVSTSGGGSGGPWFQSHPRLSFHSCSRYRLNQMGKYSRIRIDLRKVEYLQRVSNTRLYFTFLLSYTQRYYLVSIGTYCRKWFDKLFVPPPILLLTDMRVCVLVIWLRSHFDCENDLEHVCQRIQLLSDKWYS